MSHRRPASGAVTATCIALLATSLAAGALDPTAALPSDGPKSPTLDPCGAVEAYLQALVRSDFAAADSAWVRADLDHARRLGIRYAGGLPKQDNASPVLGWIAALRAGNCRLELARIDAGERTDRAVVRACVVDSQPRAEAIYHTQRDGAAWRLASPLRHATEDWPRREGRYIRLIVPDAASLDPFVVSALDDQVERFARTLQLADSTLAQLRKHKLDWLLASGAQVAAIVGTPTQGLANLQFDAVITQERFHAHELAHLMAGVWLGELPLYTLPLLQEGLAVHLGGRFGKSPQVEAMLGGFVLANAMTSLDELLAAESFQQVPPDQAYAVAGLFCGFLMEKLGPSTLGELYRALGGTGEQVSALGRGAVVPQIERASGSAWSVLEAEFAAWWPEHAGTGIGPGCSPTAGGKAGHDARPCRVACDNLAWSVQMGVVDDNLRVVVKSTGESPRGALLLTTAARLPPASRRFAEQVPNTVYRGQRLGIVFDADEVGLYDFGLDLLLAKFARGLGGAGEVWDPTAGTLCVEVQTRLLPVGFEAHRWECVAR